MGGGPLALAISMGDRFAKNIAFRPRMNRDPEHSDVSRAQCRDHTGRTFHCAKDIEPAAAKALARIGEPKFNDAQF